MSDTNIIELEFDPVGNNPKNWVPNERHTIGPKVEDKWRFIKPKLGPLFTHDVVVSHRKADGTWEELVPGTHYTFGFRLTLGSRKLLQPLYTVIQLIDNRLVGEFSVSYHSVGSSVSVAIQGLKIEGAKALLEPKRYALEDIIDAPITFPTIDHDVLADDVYGWNKVTEAIMSLAYAIAGDPLKPHMHEMEDVANLVDTLKGKATLNNSHKVSIHNAQRIVDHTGTVSLTLPKVTNHGHVKGNIVMFLGDNAVAFAHFYGVVDSEANVSEGDDWLEGHLEMTHRKAFEKVSFTYDSGKRPVIYLGDDQYYEDVTFVLTDVTYSSDYTLSNRTGYSFTKEPAALGTLKDVAFPMHDINATLDDHEARITALEEDVTAIREEFDDYRGYTLALIQGLDYRVTQLELNGGGGDGEPDEGVEKTYDWGATISPELVYTPGTYSLAEKALSDFGLDEIAGIDSNIVTEGNRIWCDSPDIEVKTYIEVLEITYGGNKEYGFFKSMKIRLVVDDPEVDNSYFAFGHTSVAPEKLTLNNARLDKNNGIGEEVNVPMGEFRLYAKTPKELLYLINLPLTGKVKTGNIPDTLGVKVKNAVRFDWYKDGDVIEGKNDEILPLVNVSDNPKKVVYKCFAFNEDDEELESKTIELQAVDSLSSGEHTYTGAITTLFKQEGPDGVYDGGDIDGMIVTQLDNGVSYIGRGVARYTDAFGEVEFVLSDLTYEEGVFKSVRVSAYLGDLHNWGLGGKNYTAGLLTNDLEHRPKETEVVNISSDASTSIFVEADSDNVFNHQDVAGVKVDADLNNFYYTHPDGSENYHNRMETGWHRSSDIKDLSLTVTCSGEAVWDEETHTILGENNEEFEIYFYVDMYDTVYGTIGWSRQYLKEVKFVPKDPQTMSSIVGNGDINNLTDTKVTQWNEVKRSIYTTSQGASFPKPKGSVSYRSIGKPNDNSEAWELHFHAEETTVMRMEIDVTDYRTGSWDASWYNGPLSSWGGSAPHNIGWLGRFSNPTKYLLIEKGKTYLLSDEIFWRGHLTINFYGSRPTHPTERERVGRIYALSTND